MKTKSKRKNESAKRIFAMVCAAIVAIAFLASIILPLASAATQKQIDDAKAKTEKAQEDLDEAKKKAEDAIAQYRAIDKQIGDIEFEISAMESQIEQTKNDIFLTEEALKKAEAEYAEYLELFKVRARAMYENTQADYLEILFGSDSFSDFLSKMEIVSQLVEYDNNILEEIETTKKEIETTKQTLEDTLKQQEEAIALLDEKKVELEEILAEKHRIMVEAEKDIEKYKAIYEAAEKEEEALINSNKGAMAYSSNPVEYTGGKFMWPVPSTTRISSNYGYRIHPIYKVKKFHTGVDISAAYGVDIVAAGDGTVTLATTNGGYGKCIIINHGSGISTLYAHNSSLLVSVGDKVTRGQVIAKAGSTGVSTGPHLHFEVRINGATTDPIPYVTK